MTEALVLETSAWLDLFVGNDEGAAVREVIRGHRVHVSDHAAVEVAAALRTLSKRGLVPREQLVPQIRLLATAPFTVHQAFGLLAGAAKRRLSLGDALCVELSARLGMALVTTNSGLATVWPDCRLATAIRR
ncbi:MAG: type II toxin-antitoxin system VapC family toxin [Candidatus Dormibacteria bacterium]